MMVRVLSPITPSVLAPRPVWAPLRADGRPDRCHLRSEANHNSACYSTLAKPYLARR
jgi:hypothetical protein